ALRGPPALGLLAALWLILAMGIWSAVGLVAGIPLDALTWLGVGLAAAAGAAAHEPAGHPARRREARSAARPARVACARAPGPGAAVRGLARVPVRGGRVLASTHGVQVYHPNPVDLWRWTHAGLERLFSDNGEWRSLTVRPGSGTAACVGMVVSIYLDLALRR